MKTPKDGRSPAPCGHPRCQMKPVEARAQVVAAVALDDPDLTRLCEQDSSFAGGAIPDFISGRHVVEVKELTSRSLRKFTAAYAAVRE